MASVIIKEVFTADFFDDYDNTVSFSFKTKVEMKQWLKANSGFSSTLIRLEFTKETFKYDDVSGKITKEFTPLTADDLR